MKITTTTVAAATALTIASLLVAGAQDRPSRIVTNPAGPAEPVLEPFLQEEIVEFPGAGRARTRTFTDLPKMHDAYFHDFASKPGFGASRIMQLPPQDYLTFNGETYRFAAPNLLGLEDQPLAYLRPPGDIFTARLMSKKQSRALLKRRALTETELRAVAELRQGKDLVTLPGRVTVLNEHGTNVVAGVLAVGALRAKGQCATCHQVKEGALLGAFAYTLVPTNSVAPRVLATLGRR